MLVPMVSTVFRGKKKDSIDLMIVTFIALDHLPQYNGELSPAGIRGTLVSMQQLAITFGIMISYWIAYGTNRINKSDGTQSDAAWRIPLLIQLVPALILLVGAFFLPHSPRWLMLRGREEECLATLSRLRDMPPDSVSVRAEFMALQAEQMVEEDEKNERYGKGRSAFYYAAKEYQRLFTTGPLLHRLSLAACAQFLQQWSGINAVI